MLKIVDNFHLAEIEKRTRTEVKGVSGYYGYRTINLSDLSVYLSDYLAQDNSLKKHFSFFKDEEKRAYKNQDDLIIQIKTEGTGKDKKYFAKTGNYVGRFNWNNLDIDIRSRFPDVFLERMLNFANDVFVDDVSLIGTKTKHSLDVTKFIVYYLFVQNLEKAFLLGAPKNYVSVQHHDMKLKGKVDINRYIKNDIPFVGKISSVSREQQAVQEIIDVLHKTVSIVDKSTFNTTNIIHIKSYLKQHKSNRFVSNAVLKQAQHAKALQNPIFAPYKKVLEYAEIIIQQNNLEEKATGNKETLGFIINVAELFEVYITKLLSNAFPSWTVKSPKIELYPDQFYRRKIIPDIVMTQGKEVIVFDTKYKRMKMGGRNQFGAGDVDREDFFQINTYMGYYQNQGYKLKVGGLIYPMESFEQTKSHSDNWFGNSNAKFVVDGIELAELEEAEVNEPKFASIAAREKAFIARVKELIDASV